MDVLKKIESFGSAPKGIVKTKLVIVDCGSAGEGALVGPPPPPPCPKVFFDMTAGKILVPKHFLLVQIFWPRPKIELHLVLLEKICALTKYEYTFTGSKMFCARPKYFVSHQKMISIQ
jgi:hypothetical protein